MIVSFFRRLFARLFGHRPAVSTVGQSEPAPQTSDSAPRITE